MKALTGIYSCDPNPNKEKLAGALIHFDVSSDSLTSERSDNAPLSVVCVLIT